MNLFEDDTLPNMPDSVLFNDSYDNLPSGCPAFVCSLALLSQLGPD